MTDIGEGVSRTQINAVLDDFLKGREFWTGRGIQHLRNWDDELGRYVILGPHLSESDRAVLERLLSDAFGAALVAVAQAFDESMRAPIGMQLAVTTVSGQRVCADWTSALLRRASERGSPLPTPLTD